MPYSLESIGKALAAERERRGLTQRALARRAGATQARISKIENGEIDPGISTVIELARALDLDLTLVPRRHLPAVNAIIGQKKLAMEEKSIRMTLSRLSNLIVQLLQHFPENEDLKVLDRTSRELNNFRLTADLKVPLLKILDRVNLVSETPALLNTLDATAQSLRQIRNEFAHRLPEDTSGPRPAYRLEEDEYE